MKLPDALTAAQETGQPLAAVLGHPIIADRFQRTHDTCPCLNVALSGFLDLNDYLEDQAIAD